KGEVVIAYSRSGLGPTGQLSAVALVGHTAGGLTTFDVELLLKQGLTNSYHYQSDRWGDYTTTVVDPTNPEIFWTFQQYADGPQSWATRISQIIVPEPSSVAMAAAAVVGLAVAAARARRTRNERLRSQGAPAA